MDFVAMPSLASLILLALSAPPALAHGEQDDPSWTFDPWVVTPLLLLGILYALGTIKLSRRANGGRRTFAWKSGAYALGWVLLAVALVSPIHALGERLFTIHMVEHEIIMALAAPLLVLARPAAGFLWGLPRAMRRIAARAVRWPPLRRSWCFLTTPRNATILHGLAIWIWHVPTLFDNAVSDVPIHRMQHLSFLGTAVLFWWALIWRAPYGAAAWHTFVTMIHTSVLGALLALAPRIIYETQTAHASEWGLTPLEDQQLAGIVMWIPAGTIYAAAALAFMALWISRSAAIGSHGHALSR